MSYNPGIPAVGSLISTSRAQIQTNFSQANTLFGVDHVPFDGGANAGKHNMVTILQSAVGPGSAVNELVLYQKLVTASSELFFQRDNVATEIQLTKGTPLSAAVGYTFLAGNLYLQWGFGTASEAGTLNTFAIAFGASPYSVTANRRLNAVGTAITISAVTATTFTARTPTGAGTVDIYYSAIGTA